MAGGATGQNNVLRETPNSPEPQTLRLDPRSSRPRAPASPRPGLEGKLAKGFPSQALGSLEWVNLQTTRVCESERETKINSSFRVTSPCSGLTPKPPCSHRCKFPPATLPATAQSITATARRTAHPRAACQPCPQECSLGRSPQWH